MLVDLSERIFNLNRNFEITFEIKKKAQFRQGNNVIVLATKYVVYPLKPLRALQGVSNPEGEDAIFRGFNGRLVAKNPDKTTPKVMAIWYAQYMRYLSLCFLFILGLTPEELQEPIWLSVGPYRFCFRGF
jgi:hypothetical protein